MTGGLTHGRSARSFDDAVRTAQLAAATTEARPRRDRRAPRSAINGLLAAPILVLLMLLANNRKIMGERTNGRWLNVLGRGTTIVMSVAAVALIVTTIRG